MSEIKFLDLQKINARDAVEIKDVCAGVVITRNMRGENIRTGVLLTGQIDGNVETILDTPRAMLAGLTAP